jgi:transposase
VEEDSTFPQKKRNEDDFRKAQQEIEQLRKHTGETVVAYVDEAGFSMVHPNRNAWTPIGRQHLIPAVRGKRLNLIGALMSTGELLAHKIWNTSCTNNFIDFIKKLVDHVKKPLTIILDNASIHKSKEVVALQEELKSQGVEFYFLPAYSPELNRIELLWHQMKHRWMAPKNRTRKEMEKDIDEIIDNFGDNYKFSF